MYKWRGRLITMAAIAGDVGLFGCLLYFIVLNNFAYDVEVCFGVWFTGLCFLCLINEFILRRGVSLRIYTGWNLLWGILYCGVMTFLYKTEPFSVWSYVWYLGILIASIFHCAYMSFHQPAHNASLLYLDGTIAALVFVQIWEHLGGGKSTSLGVFLVFGIGMGFFALLIRAMTEETPVFKSADRNQEEQEIRGHFPIVIPLVFLCVLMLGMLLSVLFGGGLSDALMGIVLGTANILWAGMQKMLKIFERFLLWIAAFAGSEETGGMLPEAPQEMITQIGNIETPTLPGWIFAVLIASLAAAAVLLLLFLGRGRLKKQELEGTLYGKSSPVHRKSGGLFRILWCEVKKRIIFMYLFVFHPEDIRMLVSCAQNYGKQRKMGRKDSETLKAYFSRLAQLEDMKDSAVRLSELSEQYYYSGKLPLITREEGKKLRKKFTG